MSNIIKNHKNILIIIGSICLIVLLIYASYVHWKNYVKTKEVVDSLEWTVPLTEDYAFRDNYIREKQEELENINLKIVIEDAKPIGEKEPIFKKVLGAKNKQGKIVIPPIYVWLEIDLEQGYILATNFENEKGHYYNFDGTDFIKKDFMYADEFKNGYACVQKEENKAAIINTMGEEILKIEADSLSFFDENRGLFKFSDPTLNSSTAELLRGRRGIVDINGNVVLEPKYDLIYKASEDKILVAYTEEEVYQEYVYLDKDFQQVSQKPYDEATVFENGVAAVKDSKGWCMINENEEVITRLPGCKDMYGFSEGVAIAEFNKEIRYYDTKGNIIFTVPNRNKENAWSTCKSFSEGKVGFIGKNRKIGYMDTEGNVVVPPIFDDANMVENGEAFVEIGEKAGVIRF